MSIPCCSKTRASEKAMVAGLGALNLFGVIVLGSMLKKNAVIESRNVARKQRARALELPDPALRRKLVNARDMAKRTVIGADRIVYTTEMDVSDQEYESREWDRRFRELERSD
ncbi:hypothetical protein KSP40_PGU014012 [Platanthera guangdongensis]|uniref:Uncharacterized protein n=1 Tax=Platanthera guangdongensis TaxID=2320717 RepID=A0ABR2MK69_9ASPA